MPFKICLKKAKVSKKNDESKVCNNELNVKKVMLCIIGIILIMISSFILSIVVPSAISQDIEFSKFVEICIFIIPKILGYILFSKNKFEINVKWFRKALFILGIIIGFDLFMAFIISFTIFDSIFNILSIFMTLFFSIFGSGVSIYFEKLF